MFKKLFLLINFCSLLTGFMNGMENLGEFHRLQPFAHLKEQRLLINYYSLRLPINGSLDESSKIRPILMFIPQEYIPKRENSPEYRIGINSPLN